MQHERDMRAAASLKGGARLTAEPGSRGRVSMRPLPPRRPRPNAKPGFTRRTSVHRNLSTAAPRLSRFHRDAKDGAGIVLPKFSSDLSRRLVIAGSFSTPRNRRTKRKAPAQDRGRSEGEAGPPNLNLGACDVEFQPEQRSRPPI